MLYNCAAVMSWLESNVETDYLHLLYVVICRILYGNLLNTDFTFAPDLQEYIPTKDM